MARLKYFLSMLALMLGALLWGEGTSLLRLQAVTRAESAVAEVEREAAYVARRDLFEALDRVVSFERSYRAVYGSFTAVPSLAGYVIPAAVSARYRIEVREASRDRLSVVAMSDARAGFEPEIYSIDDKYEVRSIHPVPAPRTEYLQAMASRRLRAIAARGLDDGEDSVFRGYFRYGVRPSEGFAYAIGIRAPVRGLELEQPLSGVERASVASARARRIGQDGPVGHLALPDEEAALVQRFLEGDVSRPERDLSDLARIAEFAPHATEVVDIDLPARAPASDSSKDRQGFADEKGLQIEPILGVEGDAAP